MEKTDSMKESDAEASLSLKDRFSLRGWDILIVIAVAFLIGSWVYLRGNRADEGILGRPLRVGIVSWPGYAGGLVANNGLRANKDSYFWNQHKLLVEFIEESDETKLLSDFSSGKLDIIWSTVDSLAQQAPGLRKKGIHPRAFMQVDWSRGGDAIIASSEINSIEGLKGKRIAVSMAASQWLLEYSLENSSLTDDDRRAIRKNIARPKKGSEGARDLFVNNSVDAAVLWEPDVKSAKDGRPGAHKLIDTLTATNMIADVMVAKEDFIQQYPNVIKAFIDGWLMYGTTEANKDPMLAVRVLQSEQGFENLSEKDIQDLLPTTVWATLEDNAQMFGLSGNEAYFNQLFSRASDLWLKLDYITPPVTAPEDARDTGLLNEIYRAAHPPLPQLNCGEETPLATIPLPIVFAPNKSDLSDDAKGILDKHAALFILQSYRGARLRFCIQSDAVQGDAPQTALEITRARERAVIDYLVEHYKRERSDFVSATSAGSPGTTTQFIRLKLEGGGNR